MAANRLHFAAFADDHVSPLAAALDHPEVAEGEIEPDRIPRIVSP